MSSMGGANNRDTDTAATVANDPEVMAFLARRLTRTAGDNGISSDALIAAAATGSVIPDEVYPHDHGDFGRCCEAYSRAPSVLRHRMLPQLVAWGEKLIEMEAERGW